jgi:hypothetical protein
MAPAVVFTWTERCPSMVVVPAEVTDTGFPAVIDSTRPATDDSTAPESTVAVWPERMDKLPGVPSVMATVNTPEPA